MEMRAKIGKTRFVNDTCATTPLATQMALESFSDAVVLIAGGEDKNLSYAQLASLIREKTACSILVPGSGTDKLVRELKRIGYSDYILVANLKEAIARSRRYINNTPTILFSPAAASFNQFTNEFERGRAFNDLIAHEKSNQKI
jgi:UDP-N-acetylmuramoylalanine--D-glutamate ligase